MNITVYLEWTIYLLYQKYYNIIYWKSTTIYYFSYLSFRKKSYYKGGKEGDISEKKNIWQQYMCTMILELFFNDSRIEPYNHLDSEH